MKGTGGGNAQITRGSDRSTRHRHPQSCLFITVATSTTGHVQRLSGVLSSTRRQLPGGGPRVPCSATAAAPAPSTEGSAGAQLMSPRGPVTEWFLLGGQQPFGQRESQLQRGLVFGMVIYI